MNPNPLRCRDCERWLLGRCPACRDRGAARRSWVVNVALLALFAACAVASYWPR